MATKLASIDLLAHPLRLEIVRYLSKHDSASPKILAATLGVRVENLAYHFRMLRDLKVIEIDHTTPVRGALEHFYRLNQSQVTRLLDELLALVNELRPAE